MSTLKKLILSLCIVMGLSGCSTDIAMLYSATKGWNTVIRLLLLTNGDVNAVADIEMNKRRSTPIIFAALEDHLSTVELLLEHGADPNHKDIMRYTALHAAAMNGDRAMVELLLKHGADPNAVANGDGGTPISLASRNGHEDIVQVLSKHIRAVPANDKTWADQTPLSQHPLTQQKLYPFDLEPFTISLQRENGEEQFLQTSLALQANDPAQLNKINQYTPEIRKKLMLVLGSKSSSQISTAEGKDNLSSEIIATVNQVFSEHGDQGGVQGVLFKSFVIQ